MIGKAIEPVLEPLGFDWKMGVGIISGVAAKELVVSTMGVLYSGEYERFPASAGTDTVTKNTPSVNFNPASKASEATFVNFEADSVNSATAGVTAETALANDATAPQTASGDTMLQNALARTTTPAAALAFMVFVLLYFPCIATFVAMLL